MCLRIGFIFTVKTEGIMLAGSVDGASNHPRPLSKTIRTPTAEAVWEKFLMKNNIKKLIMLKI